MSRKNEDGVYVVRAELTVDRYSLEGNLDYVIKELESVRKMATDMGMVGEGSLDFTISESGYYNDANIEITFYFDRAENEKEKAAREAAEVKAKDDAAKKRKATAEAKKLKTDAEYAEFLRLKEKFGVLEK